MYYAEVYMHLDLEQHFETPFICLSRSYIRDIFTRTGNIILLSDFAEIIRQGRCTCGQGQLLQQNRRNIVVKCSLN